MTLQLEPIARLTKDLKQAARKLSAQEARYLVDYYYIAQEDRKRSTNQQRALDEAEEPTSLMTWLSEQNASLEYQIKSALDQYTDEHPVGEWMKGIVGVGPVIAAGLLSHIDIHRAPTAGHIMSFAGIAGPRVVWTKGQKRPFNAKLKTLTWKIGQSFMKFSGREDCVYGHCYRQRKELEDERNKAGMFKDLAAELLPKFSKTTDAFKHLSEGRLPPAHIDARARRYAVKQFIYDLHGFWFRYEFGKEPPNPYPISILGHAHLRPPMTSYGEPYVAKPSIVAAKKKEAPAKAEAKPKAKKRASKKKP